MSKYYTGRGDDGYTGILGPERLPKHHLRLETVGSLDEANAALGLARAQADTLEVKELLVAIQRKLYEIMAETAALPENGAHFRGIFPEQVAWLEKQIEMVGEKVQVPEDFIVPGDTPAGAALDVARTTVRRAERRMSELVHRGEVNNPAFLPFLNRLSSLLFLLELFEIQAAGASPPTLARTG
ncbi:MAG TPA: cob(I)yrinic acid a,c-diamide adenosyltransferase [Anaerolineaceae bacterium]|nr:cob(I)yrinic acid a,c-diamide adenosyltransferase [Anaerolineaceae bacterium]